MSRFKVKGGKELSGEIEPQGAKNEALQIIAASVLVQKIKIVNCPNILDVRNLLLILENGGAKIKWNKENVNKNNFKLEDEKMVKKNISEKNVLYIDTRNINQKYFESEEYFKLAEKLRGSLMLMGPLLARYGRAYIPPTGGDKIGKRPIDSHITGFLKIGAELKKDNKGYDYLELKKENIISGTEILLDESSVTGTANVFMALSLNANNVTVFNAACETYITQLLTLFINSNTLDVYGLGSNRVTLNTKIKEENKYNKEAIEKEPAINSLIKEKEELVEHVILPDFIEVASFISLAMATKSEITIKNAGVKYLGTTLMVFDKLGCKYEILGDNIKVLKLEKYIIQKMYDGSMTTVYSQPWPKISPDILSVGIVASLQCEGSILFHETMYEARMFFVDKLVAMKASIILCDPHRVVVTGNDWKSRLHARSMTSPDIRAGIALLIAALGAEGESVIDNAEQIDRGYENIELRPAALGADITRVE